MTVDQLKQAVLERLGIIAAGESPAVEDDAKIQQAYESLHSMLTHEGLVDWIVADDVPKWAELILTSMLAAAKATEFGVPNAGELIAEGGWNLPQPSNAERQLRRQAASPYTATHATPEYF